MLEANRIMLDMIESEMLGVCDSETRLHGRVKVGVGTKLVNSVVRGPAVIGEGCVIKDAYIGPYSSVHDGCAVIGSEIEHSILLPRARVENIGRRLADSLMGCDSVVRRADGVPAATRVMLGDKSEVEIV
jgi:glucose-1-phosphate thymidylyltransferase